MGWTALHQVAAGGNGERTRMSIADGFDINEVDEDGRTPLHIACHNKHFDAAKALLDAGAEVNLQDRWGVTPIYRAVFSGDDVADLVQLLIDHGADPTIATPRGTSALSFCISQELPDYVAILQSANPT